MVFGCASKHRADSLRHSDMKTPRFLPLLLAALTIISLPNIPARLLAADDGKSAAQKSSTAPNLDELDKREFGVLRAWKASVGEQHHTAGPGDIIVVEVKDFGGWVDRMVEVMGIFPDPVIDSLPEDVKRLIRNHTFELARTAASVLENAVEGDVPTLRRLLGEDGLTQYAASFLGPNANLDGEHRADTLKKLRGRHVDAEVIKHLFAASTLSDLVPLLPPEDAQRIATLNAVAKCSGQLARAARAKLRLKINDILLDDIGPRNTEDSHVTPQQRPSKSAGADFEWFRFRLEENAQTGSAWAELRRGGLLARPVNLSLVTTLGDRSLPVRSAIAVNSMGEPTTDSVFFLEITSRFSFFAALVIFFFVLALFWRLAARTELICDTNGSFRADGYRPFSLARAQMAFWFLVIVGASLFLWIATGQLHILNETCLWLIGIGSGTALGSAVISESESPNAAPEKNRLARNRCEPLEDFRARLDAQIVSVTSAEAAAAPGPEKTALAARRETLKTQRQELPAMNPSAWRRVLEDWLTDNRVYSFHRYQMFVWTIVLGMVFITKVWQFRELPTFDGTMLALMSLTSDTYLGFKLNGVKK